MDGSGEVFDIRSGGSDLPDSGAISCILGAFWAVGFEPAAGITEARIPILVALSEKARARP